MLLAAACQQKRAVAPEEATEAFAEPDTTRIDAIVEDDKGILEPEAPEPVTQSVQSPVIEYELSESPQAVEAMEPEVLQPIRKPDVYAGQMMVYASDSMMEHRVERVLALVQEQIDRAAAIRSFGQSLDIPESQVAEDSQIHDIQLSDSLRVSLVFNPDDFKLISNNAVQYRSFARGQTQYFDWEIEPQSPGEKQLTIKIENYVNHSWSNFVSPQTIKIKVKVNQSTLWTRMWDKLQNDPGWLLDKILLPVLAFLAGLMATAIKRKLFGKKED